MSDIPNAYHITSRSVHCIHLVFTMYQTNQFLTAFGFNFSTLEIQKYTKPNRWIGCTTYLIHEEIKVATEVVADRIFPSD